MPFISRQIFGKEPLSRSQPIKTGGGGDGGKEEEKKEGLKVRRKRSGEWCFELSCILEHGGASGHFNFIIVTMTKEIKEKRLDGLFLQSERTIRQKGTD